MLLKKAFDKCDVNGNGVLDLEEMRAGCFVMAKSIATMPGQLVDSEMLNEIESSLDEFLASSTDGSGKVSFNDMLAVALPGLCEGNNPAEFFANIDLCVTLCMFSTINMQIDMYLGDLFK